MSRTLQLSDVIVEVRRLAANSPDNIYTAPEKRACSNISGTCSDGSVGCIIGQAMKNCGLDEDILNEDSEAGIESFVDRNILSGFRIEAIWCAKVQNRQDFQSTWGDAVKVADERCPL